MATVGFSTPTIRICGNRTFSSLPPPAKQRAIWIRCSAEAAPNTSSVDEAAEGNSSNNTPTTSGSPVGTTSKGLYSIISADNVQKALRGIAITNADHYGRLGITRGTSYDKVMVAYKKKCEEIMDQGLDEEDFKKEMELLEESYSILSSEEERRLYDWSLSRSENPDRYVWPFEVDITQTPTQPPPPQEPEDVGPTRLVGYFFLAWILLSFVLSVTLNR